MNTSSSYDVVVLGAGLTGLVTSFYLTKAGKRVHILEKNAHVGGVIKTHQKNGFTYESGPNSGVLGNPEAAELFEDLNGACQIEMADESSAKRLIWKGDQWHALPSSLKTGITTPLFTMKDKLRLLGEPFRKPGKDPEEKLADLVKRRMGKSFLEYAVDPFILGIYAGDPEYLVPKYALPKLYNLEQNYGSFIGGAIKKRFEKKDEREKKATRKIFSAEGGLSSLTGALGDQIGREHITLEVDDVLVSKADDGFKVTYTKDGSREVTAKNVVTTMGSYLLPKVLDFKTDENLTKIDNLEYAKVVQVALGFNEWKGITLDAFGGLVPFKEDRDILGALFISSTLKNKAPEGGALLSIFLGGYRKPHIHDMRDEELRELVKNEMSAMMGVEDFTPDLMEIFRYRHAIPQYAASSKERFEAVEQFEKDHPGLYIGGNLKEGIGMADRIKQGRSLAQRIAQE